MCINVCSKPRSFDTKLKNKRVLIMLGAFHLISQVCVVSATLVQFFANDNPELARNLDNILCLFNPLYPLMGCLNCITKVRF